MNKEVEIYTYITEKTFDFYLYQLVQNKQTFISQIMTSKTIERSHEDIDEKALSYAEIKALATGNKMIIEKNELETVVSKLNLLKQNHMNQIYELEDLIVKYYPVEIKNNNLLIEKYQKDLEIVKENTKTDEKEKFSPMTLKGKIYNKKENAGKMILELCKGKKDSKQEEIGEYRGMKMFLEIDAITEIFKIILKNNSSYVVELGNDVYGNITRIDNALENISNKIIETQNELQNVEKQFENAKKEVLVPFAQEQELQEKEKRLKEVNRLLNLDEKEDFSELETDDEEQEQTEKETKEKNKETPNR